MIIDGKAIAEDIYAELVPRRDSLGRKPSLGVVVVGSDPVIESFVRIKKTAAERLGIAVERTNLAATEGEDAVIRAVEELAARTDALIVQLPLPPHINVERVLSAIPKEKDVDAINPAVPESERVVAAPVACAVAEILERGGVSIAGKSAVVVGAGRLVGAPTAALLKKLGAHVSVVTLDEGHINDLKTADIIVCGAGNPGFIKPEHIKDGVALIDAGTSESAGKVVGDADPACAEKAALFTPVPGGVGPVAVAMIFRNLLHLAEKKNPGA